LAVDRDVTADEQLDLLFHLNANFYKKLFPLDWKQIPNSITDLTEWIKNLNFKSQNTKKNGTLNLKKFISTKNSTIFTIKKRSWRELGTKFFQMGRTIQHGFGGVL